MFQKYLSSSNLSNRIDFDTDIGLTESHIILRCQPNLSLTESLLQILNEYNELINFDDKKNLIPIYTRIFLSDVENQAVIVKQSRIFKILSRGAIRLVGNAPLDSGRISIISYHIQNKEFDIICKHNDKCNSIHCKGKNYELSFFANLGNSNEKDVISQSDLLFSEFQSNNPKIILNKELVRTWISVRDIDNNYLPFVESRRNFFANNDFDAFFPASTAVEGRSENPSQFVAIDAITIAGLQEGQIQKMEALSNMPKTIKYGVTFERGIKLSFGDRAKYMISGTASIDNEGNVSNIGNIAKQTESSINNINALISNYNIDFNNVAYLFVYIRDAKDYLEVKSTLEKMLGKSAIIMFVQSSICRPQWLMEIDGCAYSKEKNNFAEFL